MDGVQKLKIDKLTFLLPGLGNRIVEFPEERTKGFHDLRPVEITERVLSRNRVGSLVG